MTEIDEVAGVLEDLIDLMHLQVKELQKLTTHVEQTTDRVTYGTQLPLIASELNGLHQRLRQLRSARAGAG